MLKKSLVAFAAISLLSSPTFAGDPVPGVDVLLEQIPGGSIYSGSVDDDGNMHFDNLPVGTYRVFQDIEPEADAATEEAVVDAASVAETRVTRRETRRAARAERFQGGTVETRMGRGQAAAATQAETVADVAPLQISGPATFTQSDGDDIGMLTVTGTGPVVIDQIAARPLTDEELEDIAIPTAESLNTTRSNNGPEWEDADPDADISSAEAATDADITNSRGGTD